MLKRKENCQYPQKISFKTFVLPFMILSFYDMDFFFRKKNSLLLICDFDVNKLNNFLI